MTQALASAYRRFADNEAKGISPLFYEWASGVASDAQVLGVIASLPEGNKRQPNLVFAAARFCGAPLEGYGHFREWLIAHWSSVERVALTHATQTNEAGRCAVLLPLLAQYREPLALIEIGASAGLCLYPDRYSYAYTTSDGVVHRLDPPSGPSTVLAQRALTPKTALPNRLPNVAWRGGIDLNPLDVTDRADVEWLETLVWPEHDERRIRLRAAVQIAAKEPANIIAGDALEELPSLLKRVPNGLRVVVFHSAVMAYASSPDRQRFVELMKGHPEVEWISNEGAIVFPEITAQLGREVAGRMILARNGRACALVGPHGQSYEAIV